jgi:L-aminopeptidase/D-esterase-like protein
VPGIRVGQITLTARPTGCTVVLVDGDGAVGGVSQRGGAPGTRETDLLDPLNMVDRVNAIVLSGGSAFGLDAAQGVVKYLEERRIGWNVGAAGVVPIVPGAILFDLGFGGDARIRPTADCGYKAATEASDGAVAEGNVGAGAGATVGKLGGAGRAMKGGVGSASVALPNGLVVGAIAAVNAAGDVIDPSTGKVVAGIRTEDGKGLADARALIRSGAIGGTPAGPRAGANTTIAVVATNARLSKADMSRVALMADDALARTINPSHTTGDGDTVFALATGRYTGAVSATIVGALAADVLAEAIVRAVSTAEPLGGLPSARSLGTAPARVR